MRCRIELVCLALMLAIPAARADILPVPDRGPFTGSAGGLDFAVESIEPPPPPVGGPRLSRHPLQVVVLVGCADEHPNCKLARSRNLIGMEVLTVDGESLRPEKGMVRQIVDAFARQAATRTVSLELFARNSKNEPIKVAFARP